MRVKNKNKQKTSNQKRGNPQLLLALQRAKTDENLLKKLSWW